MNQSLPEKLKIANTLALAPMAGFTDSPYRQIARRFGASLTVTELVSAEGIVRNIPKTMELLHFSDAERPIGIQIFGKKPETMAAAAAIVEEMRPDLIDINMGCCAPRVCHHGSGAALLANPVLLRNIAEGIVKAVRTPVSAKIRIGGDDATLNYRDTVAALADSGISLITVHGRTRAQKYSGLARWDIIREIAEISPVPVIGNGDIGSYAEGMQKLHDSGCCAVMIGRRAVGNPWIFNGREPSAMELAEVIREHLRLMIGFYGPKGIILMRKHLAKYIHGRRNAVYLRCELMRANTMEEIESILGKIV